MINLMTSGVGRKYDEPPKEEGLINNSLPPELFEYILSYLYKMDIGKKVGNKIDIQNVVQISKTWNEAGIGVVRREVVSVLKKTNTIFIDALNKKTGESQIERQQLQINMDEAKTLLQLQGSFFEELERIIDEIKDFKNEYLDSFDCKFNFIQIYMTIGKFDKAIEVANTIADEWWKGFAFEDISEKLALGGNFDKAIEVANMNPDVKLRDDSLLSISETLSKKGNFDKAIEVADKIFNLENKGIALRTISKKLAQGGNTKKAIYVALTIIRKRFRRLALMDISETLAQQGNFDKAIKVAKNIFGKSARGSIFQTICRVSILKGNCDKAKELLLTIEDPDLKDQARMGISEGLALIDRFDEAIEECRLITDKHDREHTFRSIAKLLIQEGNIDTVLQIISDLHIFKRPTFEEICRELDRIKKSDNLIYIFNKIIEFANAIQKPHKKRVYFLTISEALIDVGNFDQAVEVINTISNQTNREFVLKMIKQGRELRAICEAQYKELGDKSTNIPTKIQKDFFEKIFEEASTIIGEWEQMAFLNYIVWPLHFQFRLPSYK